MILWHMGALHPLEQGLVMLLAFGPFVVLGIVVWRRRREDDAAESASEATVEPTAEPPREDPLTST